MSKFGLVPASHQRGSYVPPQRGSPQERGYPIQPQPLDVEAARSWVPPGPPQPGTPTAGGYLPEALSPTIATASAILGSWKDPTYDHGHGHGYGAGSNTYSQGEWAGSPYGGYPSGLHALASVTGRGRSLSLGGTGGGGSGSAERATNGRKEEGGANKMERKRGPKQARSCSSCGATDSPEWRKGPSGDKSLCNACGLRFARAQARSKKKADQAAGLTPKDSKGKGRGGKKGASKAGPSQPSMEDAQAYKDDMSPHGLNAGLVDHPPSPEPADHLNYGPSSYNFMRAPGDTFPHTYYGDQPPPEVRQPSWGFAES
ncbi:hypothetical protein BT69DRAFT_1283107 [Atractiella rhizophila]|nr:hypothetical protein BT69DRAFT_1283107 [Atractiella rhizophila]